MSLRRKVVLAGLVLLACSVLVMFYHFRKPGLSSGIGSTAFIVLFVLGSQLIRGNWNRKKISEKLRKSLSEFSVAVSEGEVRVYYSGGITRQLNREQIVRFEEPRIGGGLYLRSTNRYRYLLIPRSLDDYEQAKSELIRMGIPLAKKVIPTNAEEFIFVLTFCGTLIFAMFSRSIAWLEADLALSLFMAICGIYMIRANSDDRKRIWKPALGSLIPAILISFMIWLEYHR